MAVNLILDQEATQERKRSMTSFMAPEGVGPDACEPGCMLLVSPLSPETTSLELRCHFENIFKDGNESSPSVLDVHLACDEEGRPRGFGYVKLVSKSAADVARLRGTKVCLGGQRITCTIALSRRQRKEAKASKLFNNQASKRVGPVRDDVFTDNQF